MPPETIMSKAAIISAVFFLFIFNFLKVFKTKTALLQITLPKNYDFLKKNFDFLPKK